MIFPKRPPADEMRATRKGSGFGWAGKPDGHNLLRGGGSARGGGFKVRMWRKRQACACRTMATVVL